MEAVYQPTATVATQIFARRYEDERYADVDMLVSTMWFLLSSGLSRLSSMITEG